MTKTLAAATAAALLLLSPAALACKLELRGLGDLRFSGRYDPFAGGPLTRSFSVEVVNKQKKDCLFAVGIDQGQNGGRRLSGGTESLRYDILGPDNRSVADAPATPGNGLVVGFIDGDVGSARVEVWGVLPPGQLVAPGRYADRTTVSLYELDGGQAGRLEDTQQIRVETDVGSAMQSTLVVAGVRGSLDGRVATLDFGQLETGKTLSFGLEVGGNVPYRVRLESENGGAFAGAESGNRDGRVAYAFSMDGRDLALGGAVDLSMSAPGQFGNRNEHLFQVRVGDTSRALAGRYADSITVTVSAN